MPALLTDEQLAAGLARLPGWQQERNAIRRIYRFADFFEAMKFVHRVADLAERADHHPDLLIQLGQVTLTLATHSAGGLTTRDLDLARTIDG